MPTDWDKLRVFHAVGTKLIFMKHLIKLVENVVPNGSEKLLLILVHLY